MKRIKIEIEIEPNTYNSPIKTNLQSIFNHKIIDESKIETVYMTGEYEYLDTLKKTIHDFVEKHLPNKKNEHDKN